MTQRPPETLIARTLPRVREPRSRPELEQSSLSISDIVSALFKHRWIILSCAAAGLVAAAAVYHFYPVAYESQAKLLVRYLVERSGVDTIDSTRGSSGSIEAVENALGAEVEILTSWDLAVQTAEAVGPKRLSGTANKEAAAGMVTAGLEVTISRASNTIFVVYRNGDPELTTKVLNELVTRYFTKHLEVHRSIGAFDFVTEQTDQVRSRLHQTEDALRTLKAKVGIVSSLGESTAALSGEGARTEEQLHIAEAELAEQRAKVMQLGGAPREEPSPPAAETAPDGGGLPVTVMVPRSLGANAGKRPKPQSSPAEIPSEVIQQYQVLISRLPQLRQAKLDLLAKYTPENQLVKANQAEIDDCMKQSRELEKKFPELPSKAGPIGPGNGGPSDLGSETARLAGIEAKRAVLAASLTDIAERMKKLAQISPQIADLERQKELEEANYKYFQATLEKARVDEALDPRKIPNISAVQRPSPPIRVTHRRNKLVLCLAGAGLAVGIVLSLLTDLILNRTVKKPFELEKLVGVGPLLSIPYSKNGRPETGRDGDSSSALVPRKARWTKIAPWDANHFARSYCEAIRDRIGLYFELHQLTHKPKLVGVTGLTENAGASTLAAGLAAAMSETGDGKVLLVDVNLGPEHVHPFFRGKPAYSLKTALQPAGKLDSVADNLYLATVAPPNAGPAQLGLKKFFDLMPNLKASDFDYIIFDMPPLSETSPTIGIAPFLDKVLLIVEAEKNNRDTVKRGYRALSASRDNVAVVFNKARSYVPKWIENKI